MKKTVSELWNNIFADLNILEEIQKYGSFKISADQIRLYKEPRLMAKFDYSKQLPKIFKDNNLGILPIKNGEYIIGKFSLFEDLSTTKYDDNEIEKVELPNFIETIDPDNIYSESNALNVALLSGMFDATFKDHFFETIQGKMRTNTFSFDISSDTIKNQITVNGAAMEIDGGYESKSKIILVEAKNYLPEDFIIRQLYYPYRHWKDKVLKQIIPVFFAYENGIYNLFVYTFDDLYNYNSLRLDFIKRFMISSKDSEIIKKDIYKNIELVDELPQTDVPLPQADSFSKVICTLGLISNDIKTANDIAKELNFDNRQGKYYIDALRYLNLVQKGDNFGEYELVPQSFLLMNLELKKRNEILINQILQHKPFYDAYKYYLETGQLPSKNIIKEIIEKYVKDISEETINRRSSTIRGWIQWIIGAQV